MNEQAFQILSDAVTQAAQTPQEQQKAREEQQILDRLEERRITATRELPAMDFLFRLFHKPCFPRGELVALSGKAKSGKTFVSSILMALCLRSPMLSVERIEPRRLHVLWYDTEQSEESTQDILVHRIMPLAGLDAKAPDVGSLFDIFNVRAEGYDKRLAMLEVAVRHYHPDLVILDGIRDLVADINDGVVAQDCIERLMHLASDCRCCIVCVLHQNKSVEDRNLRGWIGTELKNKAFEVYQCEKSSERIFTWSQTDTRKYDILDTLKFAVNDAGLPYLCTEEQVREALFNAQRKAADDQLRQGSAARLAPFNPKYVEGKVGNKTVFRIRELFADSMESGREYDEDALQTQVGIVSNIATAKVFREQLSKAVQEGVVIHSVSALNGKKIYLLRPQPLPAPAPPRQTVLQFQSDNDENAPY